MGLFKFIRKIFQVLKSQASPAQIALGLCVGIMLGLTPLGWHSLILLTVALVLNISLGGVSLGFAVFKVLFFIVRPYTYAVGFFILEDWGQLNWLWEIVFFWPVLAWAELNQYLVFGGYVVAVLVSALIFPLVTLTVNRYRANYGERIRSEKLKQMGQTWYGKFTRWLAVGGEAKFEDARKKALPFRILRWQMLVAIPIIYGLIYVGSAYAVPFFASNLVTAPTALVLGTDVGVAEATYDPLNGQLTFNDFNVVDPKNPDQNLMVVGRASLDIGLVGLMQKRAVINRASVETIELNVKREQDGTINLDNVGGGWDVEGYLEWIRENAGKVDWIELLNKLWEYLQSRPPAEKPEPRPDLSGGLELTLPHSWFALESIGAERFELTLTDEFGRGGPLPALRQATLEMEHFELAPRYAKQPMNIALSGEFIDMPGAKLGMSARFDPQGNQQFVSTYEFAFENIDLIKFKPLYESTMGVNFNQGVVSVAGKVVIGKDGELEGDALLRIAGLDIGLKADQRSLFGFDPLTSEQIVNGINRFARDVPIEFAFTIGGNTHAPQFNWNAAFVEIAIKGLEQQANVLLQPVIQLLKVYLQDLGLDSVAPELDEENAVDTIQNFLDQLFNHQKDKGKE